MLSPHATINWQVIPEEIEPAMVEGSCDGTRLVA